MLSVISVWDNNKGLLDSRDSWSKSNVFVFFVFYVFFGIRYICFICPEGAM